MLCVLVKKMSKKLVKRIVALVTATCAVLAMVSCQGSHKDAPTPKVVLFIGDGMGLNHVYNGELYYEESMYFSGFETQTLVDTNSLSGTTDSAAAATAMATGQRVRNNYVASDGVNDITSITELAKKARYGAGVVTSDEITGATPAGFSAHATTRDDEDTILTTQANSKLDLLVGAGSCTIEQESRFTDNGWKLVTKFDELSLKKKPIVSNFMMVVPSDPYNLAPSLTQLAEFSIEYMEKNYSNGYFLMIEGAKIDKASHSNNIDAMLENLYDFNSAIKLVDEMLKATGDEYTIIVTADHETGNLDKAESKLGISNDLYNSTGHTNANVGLYFRSTLDTVPEILNQDLILNTDIFQLCKYLLALK